MAVRFLHGMQKNLYLQVGAGGGILILLVVLVKSPHRFTLHTMQVTDNGVGWLDYPILPEFI